jgi:hypothetical protein
MAKSSNKSKEAAVPESGSTAPDLTSASAPSLGKPFASKASAEKPAKAKKRPQATGKRARAAAGKTAAARRPRATTPARKTRSAGNVAISDEDIRIRAYFISEQRRQRGVAGDSAHDWLESRRQLQKEAGKSA